MSNIKQTYYVCWATWIDQPINTPWDFWFLSQGTRYRPRNSQNLSEISKDEVAEAFASQNQKIIEEFEKTYINDVKLIAFVDAVDEDSARLQITRVFPDAEIEKARLVDPTTKRAILNLIAKTLAKQP